MKTPDQKTALAISKAFKALNGGAISKDDGAAINMVSSGVHEGWVIQDLERFIRSVKSTNEAKRGIIKELSDLKNHD